MRNKKSALLSPLKWAGGKRWLTSHYGTALPSEYNTYFEPFLGGASVFLDLRSNRAVLSDLNADLIATFLALRDDWSSVQRLLEEHSNAHSHDYYYEMRGQRPDAAIEQAAWFLYMNRACFNGLYRVNLKGEFNVPKGTKERILLGTDNFEEISKALQGTELLVSDFEPVVERAVADDFIYADPPYTVRHNKNGFIKYNEKLFTWEDQVRLAASIRRAVERGAKVAVSNANYPPLLELYSEFADVMEVSRHSLIGGRYATRGVTTEILIRAGF